MIYQLFSISTLYNFLLNHLEALNFYVI
jgi:hypothetical protein